jgi:hypothetical protein
MVPLAWCVGNNMVEKPLRNIDWLNAVMYLACINPAIMFSGTSRLVFLWVLLRIGNPIVMTGL